MTGKPVPTSLDPILMMNTMLPMQGQGAQPQLMDYQMSMHSLAASGQMEVGFKLLTQLEASGLLSHSGTDCYSMFRKLIKACRSGGDSDSVSCVQAAMERLCLIALPPVGSALKQDLLQ